MKEGKIEIRLCMGSSCYSRGNDQILSLIRDYLEENGLQDKVDFRGHLCQGNCKGGPNLSIGGTRYGEVSTSGISIILDEVFEAVQE